MINHKLQTFVTRVMIARSLIKMAGMNKADAWDFSADLDYSIEQDYLPIRSWKKRYQMVIRDCRKFVEMGDNAGA